MVILKLTFLIFVFSKDGLCCGRGCKLGIDHILLYCDMYIFFSGQLLKSLVLFKDKIVDLHHLALAQSQDLFGKVVCCRLLFHAVYFHFASFQFLVCSFLFLSCVHGEELDMEASSRHKLLLRGANSQKGYFLLNYFIIALLFHCAYNNVTVV